MDSKTRDKILDAMKEDVITSVMAENKQKIKIFARVICKEIFEEKEFRIKLKDYIRMEIMAGLRDDNDWMPWMEITRAASKFVLEKIK